MSYKREIKFEIIRTKIEKIKDSLIFIEDNLPDDFMALNNSRLIQNALYKEVEFAIEQVLDVCSMINAGLRLGVPETEEDILKNLLTNKVFDKLVIELIGDMKKFRNVLVHKHGDIDNKIAYENIKEGLGDFEKILKEFERLLEKLSGTKKRK